MAMGAEAAWARDSTRLIYYSTLTSTTSTAIMTTATTTHHHPQYFNQPCTQHIRTTMAAAAGARDVMP
jgi:hypothetical protein